jgi:hypothetical protein
MFEEFEEFEMIRNSYRLFDEFDRKDVVVS